MVATNYIKHLLFTCLFLSLGMYVCITQDNRNPTITKFYSDQSIRCVGNDFYLLNNNGSKSETIAGLQIFKCQII